jgi:RimJ/RimL family protein N-acetyltransferase
VSLSFCGARILRGLERDVLKTSDSRPALQTCVIARWRPAVAGVSQDIKTERMPSQKVRRLTQSDRVLSALSAMTRSARNLYTAQLALLFTKPSDFWELWDLWSNSDIGRRMLSCEKASLDLAIASYDARQIDASLGSGIWLIKTSNGVWPIGCASLVRSTLRDSSGLARQEGLDLQIELVPRALGQGLAQEAARALVRHAFSQAGVQFITATLSADAVETIEAFERIGLRRTTRTDCAGGTLSSYVLTRQRFGADPSPSPIPMTQS